MYMVCNEGLCVLVQRYDFGTILMWNSILVPDSPASPDSGADDESGDSGDESRAGSMECVAGSDVTESGDEEEQQLPDLISDVINVTDSDEEVAAVLEACDSTTEPEN